MIDKNKIFLQSLDEFVQSSVKTMNDTGVEPIHIHRYLQDKLSIELQKIGKSVITKK